jgi:DNA-directed RNA polymerase specialized sigma24 family protein
MSHDGSRPIWTMGRMPIRLHHPSLDLLRGADRRTREVYVALRSGCTYEEIAADWGISKRAIKRCVARALSTIMENIEHVRVDK